MASAQRPLYFERVHVATRMRFTFPLVALGAVAVAVSVEAALLIGRSETISAPPLIAMVAVAGAIALLSFKPESLLLLWLSLAPFLQNSADNSHLGHGLALALYQAPTLVFVLWAVSRGARIRGPRFVDVLPALYLAYVFGSLFLTGHPDRVLTKNVYITVGIGVVIYYFVTFGPFRSFAAARLIRCLLVVSIVESVMSVVDAFAGWNLWNDTSWDLAGGLHRPVATLASPAALGVFIGIGIVFALSLLVWHGPAHLRRLCIATIAVGTPGLLLTYTRAPIIATTFVAVVILASRASTRLVAVTLLILAIAVTAASWSRLTQTSLYRNRIANDNTVAIRSELQRWSLKFAEQKPLFGWGYGSFDRLEQSTGLSSGTLSRTDVSTSTSHNSFLTILVEYGTVGLALLLVPWLVIGWGGLVQASKRPELRWLLVGALGSLTIYALAANSIDFRFFSFVPALPWLSLALLRRHQLAEQE